jgi:putative tryptophan/tyrosine transport system substrate-binding protein
MRRREFVALASGALAAWPLHALSQPAANAPTVGFLGSGTPSSQRDVAAAFARRLSELGWTDGSGVTIAYRFAEGRAERTSEIAAEFVQRKVNVIVASGSASVAAAKQATSTIPIVFSVVNDPLGTGVVKSLARPGGNVTGLSLQNPDLAGKRLDLLREAVPGVRRLAIMVNGGNPGAVVEAGELKSMMGRLGVQPIVREIRRAGDIATVLRTLHQDADALYVCSDALTIGNRAEIATLALAARVPTINGPREFAEAGGLIAYGANIPDLFRRAAEYVDKILRGTKPADLPVEQPVKFDLIVNQKTAKALGITVPPTLLARADEVIE